MVSRGFLPSRLRARVPCWTVFVKRHFLIAVSMCLHVTCVCAPRFSGNVCVPGHLALCVSSHPGRPHSCGLDLWATPGLSFLNWHLQTLQSRGNACLFFPFSFSFSVYFPLCLEATIVLDGGATPKPLSGDMPL